MAKKETSTAETSTLKQCFIVPPLGMDGSEIRRKADGVIQAVLKPVLEELGYRVIAPHEIDNPGSITQQVIEHLLLDQLVIANLTDLNPNVMYELAVRHATRLPVVCIAERGTNLPFDIASERIIFYDDDMAGVEALKVPLKRVLDVVLEEKDPDNPIYRAKKNFKMQEVVGEDSAQTLIIESLETINRRLNRMELENQTRLRSISSVPPSPNFIRTLRLHTSQIDGSIGSSEIYKKILMELPQKLDFRVNVRPSDITLDRKNNRITIDMELRKGVDTVEVAKALLDLGFSLELAEPIYPN